jgi:hypothetical protein
MVEHGDQNGISRSSEASSNYFQELASDIWHGELLAKHPVAAALGGTALAFAGSGAAWAIGRRIGALLVGETAALESGAALSGQGITPLTIEAASAGPLSARLSAGAEQAALKESVPASLYEKLVGTPSKEVATRLPVYQPAGSQLKILSEDPGLKRAITARQIELKDMGLRSETSSWDYLRSLQQRTNVGKIDADTAIARTYGPKDRIRDIVVRTDENSAVEQVTKPNRAGQHELEEMRYLDFTSGEARSYFYTGGSNGVLRSTVARGSVTGKWLGEDAARKELSEFVDPLFYRAADGRDLTGIHSVLDTL